MSEIQTMDVPVSRPAPPDPLLSVVVTIVDGGETLRRCLRGLVDQQAPPPLDVLIPFDDTVAGAESLSREFPTFRFLPLGSLATTYSHLHPAGQHELFDRRRAAGLLAARGDLVAILEDRGVPRQGWARAAILLHRSEKVVIGGAIQNGVDRPLNWAVYFCDFGRYRLPFPPGPAAYASDVNVCYKRTALEEIRDLWVERYHETTVHWALQRSGAQIYLSPELVVDQVRSELDLGSLLRERFHWARLFAYTRTREISSPRRILLALLSPILPLLLLARLWRLQIHRPGCLRPFLTASPAIVLLLVAWSAGEAFGYLSGEA